MSHNSAGSRNSGLNSDGESDPESDDQMETDSAPGNDDLQTDGAAVASMTRFPMHMPSLKGQEDDIMTLDQPAPTIIRPAEPSKMNVSKANTSNDKKQTSKDNASDDKKKHESQLVKLKMLMAENQRLKKRQQCRQCKTRQVSLTFLPCGHYSYCQECGQKFNTCPICKKTILADVRTFLA